MQRKGNRLHQYEAQHGLENSLWVQHISVRGVEQTYRTVVVCSAAFSFNCGVEQLG